METGRKRLFQLFGSGKFSEITVQIPNKLVSRQRSGEARGIPFYAYPEILPFLQNLRVTKEVRQRHYVPNNFQVETEEQVCRSLYPLSRRHR